MKKHITPLGEALLAAMKLKAAELGLKRFTYRALEEASGVNFSHAARVVRGQRNPSRELIESLSKALRPYLSLDDALIAAGYLPQDGPRREALRDLARLPLDVLDYARQRADELAATGLRYEPKEDGHEQPAEQSAKEGSQH